MKFTIAYKVFSDALAKCAVVSNKHVTIPILQNVMVRCDARNIVFRATDLDTFVDVACVVGSDMPTTDGAVTFPCHNVAKFMKAAKCDLVELEASETGITIRAGLARVSFPTLPIEDFPHPINETWRTVARPFSLPAADWHTLIGQTQFAISTEEVQYYLNGVYIHEVSGQLRFVTTDGRRLAKVETFAALPTGDYAIPGVVFPRQAVARLKKIMPKKGDISVAIAHGNTVLQWGNILFRTKNIDGSFPDYERVIPKDNKRVATMSRGELAAMLPRVLTAQTERSCAVKLAFSRGELTVSTSGPDGGTASETMAVDWQGELFEVVFNGKYLGDILAATSGADVQMFFDEERGADCSVVLRDPSVNGATFVQSTIRV
ncbi:MAG: DNA polymerase III subunit beta [Hyphomicrobium sp.]|jgi:DNA polymerase-3 subunit beta